MNTDSNEINRYHKIQFMFEILNWLREDPYLMFEMMNEIKDEDDEIRGIIYKLIDSRDIELNRIIRDIADFTDTAIDSALFWLLLFLLNGVIRIPIIIDKIIYTLRGDKLGKLKIKSKEGESKELKIQSIVLKSVEREVKIPIYEEDFINKIGELKDLRRDIIRLMVSIINDIYGADGLERLKEYIKFRCLDPEDIIER